MAFIIIDNVTGEKVHADIARHTGLVVPNVLYNLEEAMKYIDADPDSEVPKRLRELKHCAFNRHYAANNLHHDSFTIYY
mgnify:CR=1 FL=1